MILIYRCENPALAEFLREHGIEYDIEGRDRNGAAFYGYYKSDDLDFWIKLFNE